MIQLALSGVPGPGVSGVPGPGVSGVAGVSRHPPSHIELGTSTALEVALQVMVLLQMMDSQNFTSCHQSKPL